MSLPAERERAMAQAHRPSPTRRKTQRRLLDAAEELLQQTSVSALTVTMVVTRAGIKSRKTFYRHFAGVPALVQRLIEERTEQTRAITLPEPGEPAAGYMWRGLQGLLEMWRAHAAVWLAAMQLPHHDERWTPVRRTWDAILKSWVEAVTAQVRDTHARHHTAEPPELEERLAVWLEGMYFSLAQLFSFPHTVQAEEHKVRMLWENGKAIAGLEHPVPARPPAGDGPR